MLRSAGFALLIMSAGPAAAVNLVTNPGFETGTFSGWTADATFGTTITTGAAFAGAFDARLRNIDNVARTLSQLVPTTTGAYRLEYFLRNTGTIQGQDASIDSLTVTSGATVTVFGNRPGFAYSLFSQDFLATGPTTISFTYLHPNPGSFQLDNVSVTSIPEAATWAMLVTGFAFVGFASRRRKASVSA